HQATGSGEFMVLCRCWDCVPLRQFGKLIKSRGEEGIPSNNKPAWPKLAHGRKRHLEITFAVYAQHAQIKAKCTCGLPSIGHLSRRIFRCRIPEETDCGRGRNELAHELKSLWSDLHIQGCRAGDVAARSAQAVDPSQRDRITTGEEDDRNCPGR